MRSNFYKFLILFFIIFPGMSLLIGSTTIDKPLQYNLIFEGNEKIITCTKNEDEILLAPLKDVSNLLGYKVEECGRCGKDEVFNSNDTAGGKGHLFVNWYKNIITYSNDASIISLDAVNVKYDTNTYTSLELYKYMGFTYSVDDSNKTINIKRTSETSNSFPIEKKSNIKIDLDKNGTISDSIIDIQNSATNKSSITKITYAYDPNCTSCKEITDLLKDIESKYDIQIEKIDVTNNMNESLIKEYNSKSSVPEIIRNTYPILYIDDKYLFDVEINNKNIETLLAHGSVTHNFKNENFKESSNLQEDTIIQPQENDQKVLVYFYSSTCASCKKVEDYITDLKRKYSNVKVISYNLLDTQNIQLLEVYGNKYNLDKDKLGNIPAIFLSQTALVGDKDITNMLEDKIEAYNFDYPTQIIDSSIIGNKTTLKYESPLQLVTVFSAGLVNGINPCSISMFLFLLSIVMVEKKKILKIGLSFCFGKFVMFFLLGTLFYTLLSYLNINLINVASKIFLILIILIFATLNINDYIVAKAENYNKMVLQLPRKLKRFNHNLMRKTNLYVNSKFFIVFMLLLGMLLAFGEFLCTGQIYLTSIVFLIQNNGINIIPITYLFIYSFAFVLPILAITLLVYYGKKVFNLSEMLLQKLPLIKIISSLIFIVYGIYILFLT